MSTHGDVNYWNFCIFHSIDGRKFNPELLLYRFDSNLYARAGEQELLAFRPNESLERRYYWHLDLFS